MEIVIRCKENTKACDKENQNNNRQPSVLPLKQNSLIHLLRNVQDKEQQNTPVRSSLHSQSPGTLEEELMRELEGLGLESTKKYQSSDSEVYMEIYGDHIREESMRLQAIGTFLGRHKVDSYLRAKMLDWMTEVTISYKFQPKSYFDGINYLDYYLRNKQESVDTFDLHSLGIAAMMIASKAHEIYPLRMCVVYQKIGHRKISVNKLTTVEADMMSTLDYKLNQWTFFDVASISISYFKNEFMMKVLTFICRFVAIEYEFYSKIRPAIMGEACSWVVLQIFKVRQPTWMNNRLQVVDCGKKVMGLVDGFRSVHSNLRNADRFTESEVAELVYSFVHNSNFAL